MSTTAANQLRHELDHIWDDGLAYCFDFVVADECHLLKTSDADVSICVRWLNAIKYIMISVTLISNGIADWAGYMPFCEPRQADEW